MPSVSAEGEMSRSKDRGLDVKPKTLLERLEKGISVESLLAIEKIVESVSQLSNVEKLLLYLKLPTYGAAVSTPDGTKTSGNAENVTQMWIKSHLTANENTSILRQRLYEDYRLFCETHEHESVSVSEFKRLLRSVFPRLSMRRLGSRGNAQHVYGGIAYRTQANSFTLPKLGTEACDEEVYCDGDNENGGADDEDRPWKDNVDRAAVNLVLEWAYKLLNVRFESIRNLAGHLISQNYVSQVSLEAFMMAADTNCELVYKDDVLSGNSAQKQLHTRHQLQKKIHERQEISRQKRRMEEERSYLAGQDLAALVTGKQQNSLPLVPSVRNSSSGSAVRVHSSKAANEADRNPPKPILPKMLLPKLSTTVPMSRSILSIDLDHRAVQPVDPQFILVPQNISHIHHCTPGSVVLISNTPAASTAPPSEVKVSLQSIGSIGLAPLTVATPQPERQNPSQNACDLKVPTISVVSMEAQAVSEGSFSGSPGTRNPTASCSPDFVKNSTHTLSPSTVSSSENLNSRIKTKGLQMAAVVSQGTSVMSPPVGVCPVIIASQDPVSRPVSLGSTSLKELFSQVPLLLSPKNRILLSGSDRCFEFTPSEGNSSATDSVIAPGSDIISDAQSAIGSAKIGVHSNLALCQGSKARSRTVSSRVAPRTVSSILDEQRCHSSGASRALYNDSRNVSQILKELREKHSADELSSLEKTFVGSVLLSEHHSDRASCGNSSLLNLESQKIQVLKFLHKTNYQPADKTLLDVQPRTTIPVKRFHGLSFQPKQPTATKKTNLQLPSKIPAAGQNSSSTSAPGMAFQNALSAEMPTSPLLSQSTTSGNCSVDLFKALPDDWKALRNFSSALKCTADREKEKHSEKPFPSLPSSLGFTGGVDTPQKADRTCLDRNSCTNLQKLLLKPVQTTLQLVRTPSDVSSCQTFSKLTQKTVGADGNSSPAFSWSCPTVSTTCSSNFSQNSLKRSATALPCTSTKRIMMDNEQPGFVVRSSSFDEGNDDGVHVKEDSTELTEADMQMVTLSDRLHSPGDLQDMLYKDTSLQHYTLQQLSNLQQMKTHYQKESQLRTDPLTDFGSRPASAFDSSKTNILRLSATEVGQPSRPNTVAAVWDDQNIETEILRPFVVESGHGPKTESCGSESSTPMSIQSPRSNMSCGSIYLDQSNIFMPLHMTDSLPTVAAIRPLPKHGQWQAAADDVYVADSGKLDSLKRATASFTTTASSGFTPYPSLDAPRVSIDVRPEGFASMHSTKKQKQQGSISSRQRHHSAHDTQDSCIKTAKMSSDQLMPQLISSTGDLSLLLPKLYSVEPSAFSMVPSSCSNILPGIDGSGMDVKEFETADEVTRIISASQDSLGGNPALLNSSNRSQSEPANCLQAGYPLDPYDDFPSIFNSDGDLIADSSAADGENVSSRVSDFNWGSSSEGKNAPENPAKLLWRGLTRGDHLISGITVQPSLSFPDADLSTTEFVPFENPAIIAASFVGTDCSPPESQDPSPEYEGEMPLFDKSVKGLDGFPPGGGHSTVLDTPNSLVGIFNSICSDESDGQNQSSNCGVDFWAPYF